MNPGVVGGRRTVPMDAVRIGVIVSAPNVARNPEHQATRLYRESFRPSSSPNGRRDRQQTGSGGVLFPAWSRGLRAQGTEGHRRRRPCRGREAAMLRVGVQGQARESVRRYVHVRPSRDQDEHPSASTRSVSGAQIAGQVVQAPRGHTTNSRAPDTPTPRRSAGVRVMWLHLKQVDPSSRGDEAVTPTDTERHSQCESILI